MSILNHEKKPVPREAWTAEYNNHSIKVVNNKKTQLFIDGALAAEKDDLFTSVLSAPVPDEPEKSFIGILNASEDVELTCRVIAAKELESVHGIFDKKTRTFSPLKKEEKAGRGLISSKIAMLKISEREAWSAKYGEHEIRVINKAIKIRVYIDDVKVGECGGLLGSYVKTSIPETDEPVVVFVSGTEKLGITCHIMIGDEIETVYGTDLEGVFTAIDEI